MLLFDHLKRRPVWLVSKLGPKVFVATSPLFYLYFIYMQDIRADVQLFTYFETEKNFCAVWKVTFYVHQHQGVTERPLPTLTPPNVGPIWWWAWGTNTHTVLFAEGKSIHGDWSRPSQLTILFKTADEKSLSYNTHSIYTHTDSVLYTVYYIPNSPSILLVFSSSSASAAGLSNDDGLREVDRGCALLCFNNCFSGANTTYLLYLSVCFYA